MNTATSLKEYVEIPMKELVESSTNPRKSFDEAALDELAESIRAKGVLSPLARAGVTATIMKSSPERGAFGRRSAQVWKEFPVRLALDLTDAKCSEIQIIENVVKATCIRSRKRKAFALCLTGKQALTPLRR